jgi:hypothetical protein
MTDANPTDPPTPPANPEPTPPAAPPANPAPTPPAAPSPAAEPKDDNAILAAIGELKDMLTGAVQVITTSAQPDQSPVKKPWFARGGKP